MKRSFLFAFLMVVALWTTVATYVTAQGPNTVYVGRIRGVINPVMATYVQRVVGEAERAGASVVVFEMDTPVGLMDSMRTITGTFLNARVPIVVYVAPQG